MEVEEALGTLRTARATPARTLRLLDLWSLCHKVDGMLARESLNGRNGHLIVGAQHDKTVVVILGCDGLYSQFADLLTLPGIIEHDADVERMLAGNGQVEVQRSAVALLDALEGFQSLRVLGQSAEAEVLEADDAAVGDTGQIHRVVPDVVVVLHPLVAVGATCHEAGVTCRVVLIRRKTEDLEPFRGYFSASILVAVLSLRRPLVVLRIGVVARDSDHTALGHRFLVPCDLHGSHHRLTGKAEAAWRTVIEHIPLAVDLLQRTVGVVACIGGDEFGTILSGYHTARVDQHTA